MTLLKYFKILIVTLIFVLLGSQSASAAQANFSWLPNNESDGTSGYMIYYGTSSRLYTESVDVGSPGLIGGRVCASVFQLAPEQKYFFAVVAYNADGDESSYSTEIAYTVPTDADNNNSYDIYMSTSPNLSGAIALEGATVEGDLYIFTGPDAGVSRVNFSVDGVYTNTEGVAPFELVWGGGALDTSELSPGQHEVKANIQLNDGSTKVVSAVFNIPSVDDSPINKNSHEIFVSISQNLSGAIALDGSTVEGDLYVFTGPDTDVSRVNFSVDGVYANTEGAAPFELRVGGAPLDTSQLSPGLHEITANIQLSDGSTELVSALFTIPSVDGGPVDDNYHDVFVSTSSNLSGAIALEGATVEGDLYVFTGPDAGVSRVIFSVDGVYANTEGAAPFELRVGGAPLDTSKLSPGQHEIIANIQLSDGSTELVSAVFTVQSDYNSDSLYDILVSDSPYLSGATNLQGAAVDGDIYVFTGPDTGVSRVIFSIDGVVTNTERVAPYELVYGGAAFSTSQLSPGTHEITALIELRDGSSELIGARFTVK